MEKGLLTSQTIAPSQALPRVQLYFEEALSQSPFPSQPGLDQMGALARRPAPAGGIGGDRLRGPARPRRRACARGEQGFGYMGPPSCTSRRGAWGV